MYLAPFLVILLLSGCFSPLERDLGFIYVDPIPNRLGQLMRNALQNSFGGQPERQSPYHLRIKTGSGSEGTDIGRDATFQQTVITVRADFNLLKEDKILFSGSETRRASIPFSPANPYISQSGATFLTRELIEQVSDDIRLDLLVFFKEIDDSTSA